MIKNLGESLTKHLWLYAGKVVIKSVGAYLPKVRYESLGVTQLSVSGFLPKIYLFKCLG